MSLYRPKFIKEWSNIKSVVGFNFFLKKKGWQVIFFFFTYYLIRDSLLYLIIPYFGFSFFKGCF